MKNPTSLENKCNHIQDGFTLPLLQRSVPNNLSVSFVRYLLI